MESDERRETPDEIIIKINKWYDDLLNPPLNPPSPSFFQRTFGKNPLKDKELQDKELQDNARFQQSQAIATFFIDNMFKEHVNYKESYIPGKHGLKSLEDEAKLSNSEETEKYALALEKARAAIKKDITFYETDFETFQPYFTKKLVPIVTYYLFKQIPCETNSCEVCKPNINQLFKINESKCAKYRFLDGVFTAFYNAYPFLRTDPDDEDFNMILAATLLGTATVVVEGYLSVEREHIKVKGTTAKNHDKRTLLNDCYFDISTGKSFDFDISTGKSFDDKTLSEEEKTEGKRIIDSYNDNTDVQPLCRSGGMTSGTKRTKRNKTKRRMKKKTQPHKPYQNKTQTVQKRTRKRRIRKR